MLKWRLKACPRCHGDVYIDKDMDGWYEQCLQCSHRQQLKDIFEFGREHVAAHASHQKEDWSRSNES